MYVCSIQYVVRPSVPSSHSIRSAAKRSVISNNHHQKDGKQQQQQHQHCHVLGHGYFGTNKIDDHTSQSVDLCLYSVGTAKGKQKPYLARVFPRAL